MRKNYKTYLFGSMLLFAVISCRSDYEVARISNDPQLILKTADKFYEEQDYLKAKELYTLVLTSFRGTAEAEDMYFTYAYCHYHLGDFVSSDYYFESFTNTFPNSQYREEAEFMKAYSNYLMSPRFRLTQEATLEAIESFQNFVNRYPNSSRVDECNEYMDELRRKLERKAFAQGELYYNREMYQASLHVFENVLRDYPDTEDAEKIRYLIVKSAFLWAENSIYTKQEERYELTIEKYEQFLKKFPRSTYREELREMVREANIQLKKFNDV